MKAAIFLNNIVSYHEARWRAGAAFFASCDVVEISNRDEFKILECSAGEETAYRRQTLFPGREKDALTKAEIVTAVNLWLTRECPSIVFLNGWSFPFNIAAMRWALNNDALIVICSESNENDETRTVIKEFIKKRIVLLCSAGLAGGAPHADYLVKLGLPRASVFVGYDVVDNDFFGVRVTEIKESVARSQKAGGVCSKEYFFACARFGKKKNIPGLIRAYALYRKLSEQSSGSCDSAISHHPSAFDLVIAGEGEQRTEIEQTINECRVKDYVQLVGAKGYQELPAYYANAGAFIHASTTEQWGLVVNEAMASGLPVLVSNRCGCAGDLVREGLNGFTFDPYNEEQLADLMVRIASDEEARCQMGARSREIIAEWGPDRFASGVKASVEAALTAPKKKVGFMDRLILWVMTWK